MELDFTHTKRSGSLNIKIRKWCIGSVLKSFKKFVRVLCVLILRRLLEKVIYSLTDVLLAEMDLLQYYKCSE